VHSDFVVVFERRGPREALSVQAHLTVLDIYKFLFFQVSDGGVHSHIDHLFSFLECAKELGVPKTFVQYFADGRDTRPTSGGMYIITLCES
jgi:bisphosphoglycerate-independent phosphoglycerate mutase (AlkP superfamily)